MLALSSLTTRTLPILLLLAALSGCVSVESNVDPNFDQPLNRVFVALEGGSRFEGFIEDLGSELGSKLGDRGVESDVYLRKELSLDVGGDIEARIASFAPDGILIISQTEAEYVNGATSGARFEATLLVPGRERPVWRAAIKSNTSGYSGAGSTAQIAGKIIDKMNADGLFSRTGEASPATDQSST